jgi:hypothetical protein
MVVILDIKYIKYLTIQSLIMYSSDSINLIVWTVSEKMFFFVFCYMNDHWMVPFKIDFFLCQLEIHDGHYDGTINIELYGEIC